MVFHIRRCKAGDLREARDLAWGQPNMFSQTDHGLTTLSFLTPHVQTGDE
jgi:hypothetical protein